MKLITIIQARQNSKRFPGKVLKKYKNITFLELLIKRLKRSKSIKKIIVATSKNILDQEIKKICKKLDIFCFQGSEQDVIDRYYKVAKLFKAQNIIRITADCPIIDPKVLDQVVNLFFTKKADYATNTMPTTYPDGLDVEVFNFESLNKAWKVSRKIKKFREHVTTHIRENKTLNRINLKYRKDYSFLRLTLDDPIDLNVIHNILKKFSNIYSFGIDEIIALYNKNPLIFKENIETKRNEGQNMITGQKMWKRAKQIIPGGTMLFSKNPDLFLPDRWPAYFNKSKGCKIWDLDNNCYKDLSFMGVGTNILGYAHPDVERRVIETVKKGCMTTLNSVEEIKLAEKLIELHPWAKMVRFTRSGGEANAVAIRIARASSGKDKVAVCGYHGWHDWYLSSNIGNNNKLNQHLMNNVPIKGVPKSLKNTVFPFEYNNFTQLKKIVEAHKIGVIKMEVKRNFEPKNNFLQKVRKLANDKNIVLIFDECTSGFRQTFGGLHKHYKINPDIAIFGKALGNGHAINAIIGKKAVMESCNATFISSTFWTERVGPTAALATLDVMEKNKSWEIVTNIGKKIKKKWKIISDSNKLDLEIRGIDAIPNFTFKSKNNLIYKTFITQEMLKRKILASNAIYCSISHNKKLLENYFDILNNLFIKISKFEKKDDNLIKELETRTCLGGIRESNK
jgi:glutamate-1-semialdehyde aminotransferase/spore coat polysaccharide biosynthesis protein SpsF (cytidylyltransferase family)